MGSHWADHNPCVTHVHAPIHSVFLRSDVPHFQWRPSFAARNLSGAFPWNGFEFCVARHDDSRFVFAVIPKSKYETHVGDFDSRNRRYRLDSVYLQICIKASLIKHSVQITDFCSYNFDFYRTDDSTKGLISG